LYRTTAIRKSPTFVNVPVRSDGQGEFVSASDKADGLALTLTSLTTWKFWELWDNSILVILLFVCIQLVLLFILFMAKTTWLGIRLFTCMHLVRWPVLSDLPPTWF